MTGKNTKTIKFILFIMLLIPIVLFSIGIIQTFILNSKKNQLNTLNQSIEIAKQQEEDLNKELTYKQSEEYIKDYHKYENGYSDSDDIEIIIGK